MRGFTRKRKFFLFLNPLRDSEQAVEVGIGWRCIGGAEMMRSREKARNEAEDLKRCTAIPE